MKIVSIINYKGGVGKTTITANLAAGLVQRGKRVLVIDLDPQTNLTFSFIDVTEWQKKYEKDKTIKYWFDSIIDSKSVPSFSNLIIKKNGIDIISSHLGLIDVDIDLAAELAGNARQLKTKFIKTYSYIKDELKKLNTSYDVVLFDCPPNFSIVTKNAIIASDYYLVPAKMDYLSTLGINHLRNRVNEFVSEYNENSENGNVTPTFLGVVATMISVRNNSPISAQQAYVTQLINNNITIFDSMIRENKTLNASAPQTGQPVITQSHSSGTYSDVVSELNALTDEFVNKAGI